MEGGGQSRRVSAQVVHVLFFDQINYSMLSLEEQAASMERLRSFILESAPYKEADAAGQVIPIDSGDGMALVFLQDPQVAAECALAVSEFSLKSGTPLRIGLNSGPVSLREDLAGKRNVSGAGIDQAQRVMSVAPPHRVMVSLGMAETLMSFEEWRPKLVEEGSFPIKHDQELVLYSLSTEEEIGQVANRGPGLAAPKTAAPPPPPPPNIVEASLAAARAVAKAMGPKATWPMLNAFLSQVEVPDGTVSAPGWDVPLAIAVGIAIESLPMHGYAFIPAGLSIWGVLRLRRSLRSKQIARQHPSQRAAWESWDRVRRLVRLQRNGELNSHVPAPALYALEEAARAWQGARDELRSIAINDAEMAREIQDDVDAIMMAAAAVCSPVLLRADQGKRHLAMLEADDALMNQICQKILREAQRLGQWTHEISALAGSRGSSLRDRLARALKERADAEAELNDSL